MTEPAGRQSVCELGILALQLLAGFNAGFVGFRLLIMVVG